MKVSLNPRTAEKVAIYFERAQQEEIRRMLPQKAQTLAEALADFAKAQRPGATSFGRTIDADGRYVGDVWVYAIDRNDTPNAMLSYCVFDQSVWRKGVATEAVRQFLTEVCEKYSLSTVGAFTYAANTASIRVLEKCGFVLAEEFSEEGIVSRYYQFENGFHKSASDCQQVP